MRTRGRLRYAILLTLAALLAGLVGCSTLTGRLTGSGTDGALGISLPTLGPTPATPEPTAGLAAVQPTPWPTSTTAPLADGGAQAPTPAPTGTPAPGQDLLFLSGGSLMRGGELGESPREVAQVTDVSSTSLVGTRLALLQGNLVQIVDFGANAQSSFTLDSPATLESAELLWGSAGQRLLHASVVADPQALTAGRHLELRSLNPVDGSLVSGMMIPDVAGATLLRYDDAQERVLLIPRAAEGAFSQVDLYDIANRVLVRSVPVQGEGLAALSPDGTMLLTSGNSAQGSEMLAYSLAGDAPTAPLFWELPAGTRASAFAWSPSGQQAAYLVREGEDVAERDLSGELGVWVIDMQTMATFRVIAEQGSESGLVGWTPDGSSILIYHSDGADGAHYYTIRPDGGGLRILPVNSESVLAGWLARSAAAPSEPVGIDPWQGRFASTAGDSGAAADMAAAYVAEHPDVDDALLSEALAAYLAGAGWDLGPTGPRVVRLGQDLSVAQLPGMTIQVLSGGQARNVALGDTLVAARRVDKSVGLIYGVVSESGLQPAYMLLTQGEDGAWSPTWTPQGQRDWIVTDGEVAFDGDGLDRLTVSGTSFGLDYAVDSLFAECHTCAHRQIRSTWVRDEQGYHRETSLPADASFEQALWEMTAPGPYAVLHEVLRRLKAGESLDDLLADRGLRGALEALNVADEGARFVPEAQTEDTVTILDTRSQTRFLATVRDGRLTALETLGG